MDLLLFFAIAFGALFIVAAVFQVAAELRKLRFLLETQFRLRPTTYMDGTEAYAPTEDRFEDA
tara:strand:+ start:906 stop:1094 length:189 start_codon:yes stop_codon:yes gene_type:complete